MDGRLYLVGIHARFPDGRIVALADLFPEHPDRVFADWFTGELRCPMGRLLNYVHLGFSSVFEQDLLLRFEQGVLVEQRTVTNEPPVNEDPFFDDI